MKVPRFSIHLWLLVGLVLVLACGTEPPDRLDEVPVSVDPADLEPGEVALVGRILDFETSQPISGAFVSTSPATEIVRTTAEGEFVLRENLEAGEVYRLLGEADGYRDQHAMVRAVEARRNVDLVLIATDRSLPVSFEPFAGVFTAAEHTTAATMISEGDDTLQWEIVDLPEWVSVEPATGTLEAGGTQPLELSIVPEVYTTLEDLEPYLEGRLEVQDQRGRVGLYNFIAIPAGPGQVELEIDHDDQVALGNSLSIEARVTYENTGFAGATIIAEVTPTQGLTPSIYRALTGPDGRAMIELQALEVGHYELSFALPAFSEVSPVVSTVEVVADEPADLCAADNGGCGDYAACTVDGDGGVVCEDLFFCETEDHSCDLEVEICVDQEFGPYRCEPIDFPEVQELSGPAELTSETEATLSFECSTDDCIFECSLAGAAVGPVALDDPCTSPVAVQGLSDDDYTFTVSATDADGNTGPAAEWSWSVDTEEPELMWTELPPSRAIEPEVTFGFECTNKPCTSFECSFGAIDAEGDEDGESDVDWEDCASPQTFSLTERGEYLFAVRATDEVGLSAEMSHDFVYIDTTWAQVATGTNHSCAVTTGNDLFCWGNNGSLSAGGQLGQGDTELRREPVQVDPPGVWASVEASTLHTCAVRTDHTMWCWGRNTGSGIFGNGEAVATALVPILGGGGDDDWVQLSAMNSRTCGIRSDGTLWCWGNGSFGALGLDDGNQQHSLPQQVGVEDDWIDIATEGDNTCGVREEGSLWCWGRGGSTAPEQIGPASEGWRSVAMGTSHGCGIRSGSSDSTELLCWGEGADGQTGLGSYSDQLTPAPVVGDQDWKEVVAHQNTTCAITEEGDLWCWGDLTHGRWGSEEPPVNPSIPFQIHEGLVWEQADLGLRHGCGIDEEGDLFCWGLDDYGQLGTGHSIESGAIKTEVAFVDDVLQVSAGQDYGCLIGDDQSLWCWGNADNHQLGIGDLYRRPLPFRVGDADGWVQVSTTTFSAFNNSTHTCGIRDDGSLWCWGHGGNGKLGTGEVSTQAVPQQVLIDGVDPGDWIQVSTGASHTCGLREGGELYCWGANSQGQVGVLFQGNETTPQRVGSDLWIDVAVGRNRSCGIRDDHGLWCWGETFSETTPPDLREIAADEEFVWESLDGHNEHFCALQDDQSLWCWGLTGFDRLGSPTAGPTTPGEVDLTGDGTGWVFVSVGFRHSCAIQDDTTAWCWGANSHGQLGPDTSQATTRIPQQQPGENWIEISAGLLPATGIRIEPDGRHTAFSWGEAQDGRRGDGLMMQLSPFLLDRY